MKKQIMLGCLAVVAAGATIPVRGADLCAGESEATIVDLAPGVRTASSSERIRYSSAWAEGAGSGATVVVTVDGETLSSATGGGFVDWVPLCDGTYTLTHKVMSGDTQIGETLTMVFAVKGVALCAGESAPVAVDLASGPRSAAATERVRYSTAWETGVGEGALAVVSVGGETLTSATGGGFVDWTPTSNGTYTLTHKVMSGDEQLGATLTATFLVEGLSPTYTATQTTEVPVPYAWLRQYVPGIADEYGAYEAAAGDVAANGRNKVWECYVAGLDPADTTSEFTAAIAVSNDVPYITWSPNLNTNGVVQKYTILGKESLTDTADWAPTNLTHRFFKVKVEMP